MELTYLAGGNETGCAGGRCPTVYATDRGTLVVQGYVVSDETGLELPDGEAIVEIPRSLLTGLHGSF